MSAGFRAVQWNQERRNAARRESRSDDKIVRTIAQRPERQLNRFDLHSKSDMYFARKLAGVGQPTSRP